MSQKVQEYLWKFSSDTSTDGGAELSEKTSTNRLAPGEELEFRLSRSVKGCVGACEPKSYLSRRLHAQNKPPGRVLTISDNARLTNKH